MTSISGKIGGVNFRQNSGRSIASIRRYRPVPRARALAPLAPPWAANPLLGAPAMAQAVRIWNELTAAQRDDWASWSPPSQAFQTFVSRQLALAAPGTIEVYFHPSIPGPPPSTAVNARAGTLLAGIESISSTDTPDMVARSHATTRRPRGQTWSSGFLNALAIAYESSAFFFGPWRSFNMDPVGGQIISGVSLPGVPRTTYEVWLYPTDPSVPGFFFTHFAGNLLFRTNPSGSGEIQVVGNTFLNLGVFLQPLQWYQFLFIRDTTIPSFSVALNGVIVASGLVSNTILDQHVFRLGSAASPAPPSFQGLVARPTCWDQAFSPANAALSYFSGLGRPPENFTNLRNTWLLNDPTVSPEMGVGPTPFPLFSNNVTGDLGPFTLLHHKSDDWGPADSSWRWRLTLASTRYALISRFRGGLQFDP